VPSSPAVMVASDSPPMMNGSESCASLGGVVLVSPLDARRALLTLTALFQSLNSPTSAETSTAKQMNDAPTSTEIITETEKQMNEAGSVSGQGVSGAV
jgi:hypothetical protein